LPLSLGAGLESPCRKICTYEPGAGVCLGCGRTLAEIASWSAMDDRERLRVMAELPARLEKFKGITPAN
jgi:predicted Fe-S protein YdhL (DUF1289 family)